MVPWYSLVGSKRYVEYFKNNESQTMVIVLAGKGAESQGKF